MPSKSTTTATKNINPVPKGYRTATTILTVQCAQRAMAFYQLVFNAQEISTLMATDQTTVLQCALKIGNSLIHLCDEMPQYGILSPTTLKGTANATQLYLEDIDDVWQRAIDNGCLVILPLVDNYWGERSGKMIDPFGHVWVLCKKTENLTKAQLLKRTEQQLAN